MRRLSTQVLDALALDHALGVLRGSARRRYLKYVRTDACAAQAHRAWQRRALRLLGAVTPCTPPGPLFATLSRRLEQCVRADG